MISDFFDTLYGDRSCLLSSLQGRGLEIEEFPFVNQHSEREHHHCLICFNRSIIYKWAISHSYVSLLEGTSEFGFEDVTRQSQVHEQIHHIPSHSNTFHQAFRGC